MKVINYKNGLVGITLLAVSLFGCSDGFNVFSIQDDIDLGAKVDQEIRSDPTTYPILDEVQYADAYNYLNSMKQEILNSGQIKYKDEFVWKVAIINDDNTLNAFATPGGYLYFYTGLIRYLDNASSLAGVLGHEMAHADERHSTNQLTKVYSVSLLLEVISGSNESLLAQIASDLVFLKFSRNNETDADNQSVVYLCPTKYRSSGAADFFQKIIDDGSSSPPQFLSTHPNPDNRVENIIEQSMDAGCTATITQQQEDTEYTAFKNTLP
ncbi:MAG: M48 family metalloprotease [Chitinophagales bacterium]|nr:M48 family metalloprotease [Chitinophagales bacterium]